jgi:anti-anti-sigma factor
MPGSSCLLERDSLAAMNAEAERFSAGSLEIEWRADGETLRVSWKGRLDQASADAAHRCIEGALAGARSVCVDCEHLTMMSSLGIRVVILLHKHAKSRGGTLSMIALQPPVRDVLEFSGINRLIGLVGPAAASGR